MLKCFNKKLVKRSKTIAQLNYQLSHLGYDHAYAVGSSLEASSRESSSSESQEVNELIKSVLQKMKVAQRTPTLNNDDLPFILNGNPGDPIESRPFDSTFTKEKIKNCFERVGYVPFTRKALENPNIRHELNEDNVQGRKLQAIYDEYVEQKLKLKDEGFNVEGIFDATIPTAQVARRSTEEEHQVKALVDQKSAFSAPSIFTNVDTMCITAGAVLKAQRIQLQKDQDIRDAKELKKQNAEDQKLCLAQDANEKRIKGEKLKVTELKHVLNYVLP